MNKLEDFYDFMDDSINKLRALQEGKYECDAVWLQEPVNGSARLPVGSLICLDDNDDIIKNASHASHKIVGIFAPIGTPGATLILTDVITNEPKIIEL